MARESTTHPATLPLGHIAELDGLRGLAVIGVLFFHADHLRGGFLGVDLFFVLSGWLITRLLLIETSRTGNVALGAFWGRRLRRLLPAVLALLVAVSAYAWWAGDTAARVDTTSSGPWAQWYVANWHMISGAGDYWASFSEPSMFGHLWSLAIEEQFYVVWPLVIAALWRLARNPLRAAQATTTVAIVASTTAAIVLATTSGATRVYMGTDTRAASILCGALAAMPTASRLWARMMSTRLGDAVVAACGVAVAAMWWFVDGTASEWLFRGGLTVHAAACAVVIGGVVARRDSTRRRSVVATCLSTPLLQRSGQLSYSLYLWHWPVYIVVADRTDLDGWALTGVRLGVTTAVAVAGYVMVEQYVRRRARWAHGQRGVAATAVAMAAVSIWWVAVPAPTRTIAGLDASRVLAPVSAATSTSLPDSLSSTITPSDPTSVDTVTASTLTTAPTTLIPVQPASLMVVGDSIWLELVLWNAEHGIVDEWTIGGDVRLGCGTLSDDNRPWCDGRLESWADTVEEISPDVVLMGLSHWDAYDVTLDGVDIAYGTPEFTTAVLGAWAENVDVLSASGATVVVTSIPCLSYEPRSDDFDLATRVTAERTQAMNDLGRDFVASRTDNVVWLDMRELTCPDGIYLSTIDGVDTHRDGIHYSDDAKPLVLNWLTDQLTALTTATHPAEPNTVPTSTTVFTTTTAVPTTTTIPPVTLLDVVGVLWHGDSVAHDAGPAIMAAFDAMDVGVVDLSYPGSRLTELPNGDNPLERIADAATAGRPDLIIHQLTTWDTLASPIDQRRAISDLVDIAESIGATLVIITSPVEAAAVVEQVDIDRHLAIVRQVLSAADTPSVIWDQSGVFGTTFTIDIDNDGIPERKRDGVHLCPSGAARFAVWLVNQITSISTLDAPDHSTWLSLPWADDDRYDDPPGACEPLSVAD